MAISSPPRPVRSIRDDRLEIPADADAVFETVIAGNDRVCQECYRLLRRYDRVPLEFGLDYGEILAFVEYDLPETQPDWNIVDRAYFEAVTELDRLEECHTDDGKTSFCTGCGTMTPHRSPSTRSATRARDVAIQLTVTLHELGIDHDWIHLVERVAELKREPETAGNDFECFRRATADAIARARNADVG